jgi:hypothetical protein
MNKENEAERSMSRFLPYSPEQAYLLPPSVKDELGAGRQLPPASKVWVSRIPTPLKRLCALRA